MVDESINGYEFPIFEDYESYFHYPGEGSIAINDFGVQDSSNRLRVLSDFNLQEGDEGTPAGDNSSPLGLTLTKSPSFMSLLEMTLSKTQNHTFSTPVENHGVYSSDKRADPGLIPSEKWKASNFPALLLQIGGWQRLAMNEGEVITKVYYSKKKIVWEVLDGTLKCKIEIMWSDIVAIRAIIVDDEDDEPGVLDIELSTPPLFYRETNPQPRKHTLWQQSSDFTGGQASHWRRHHVRFPHGILDKHYEKILQCDPRLKELSKQPFPTCKETPFYKPSTNLFGMTDNYLSFNGYGSGYVPPRRQYTTRSSVDLRANYSPVSPVAVDLPLVNNQLMTQLPQRLWGARGKAVYAEVPDYNIPINEGVLGNIERCLLKQKEEDAMMNQLRQNYSTNYYNYYGSLGGGGNADMGTMMPEIWLPTGEESSSGNMIPMLGQAAAHTTNTTSYAPFLFPDGQWVFYQQ